MPSSPIRTSTPSPEQKGRISRTIGYAIAFVSLGLSLGSLGRTLPGLAEHTRAELSWISYLFPARALGYMLGILLSGRWYDRVPGHPLMAAMLFIMAAMLGLAPLMSLLWILVIVILILGVAEGSLDVGGNVLLIWVHQRRVGPFMNALHFCFGLGAFLSPILIKRAELASGDITWAYWILAFLMLPGAIWMLSQSSPPAQQAASEEGAGGRSTRLLIALIGAFFFTFVGAEMAFGGWIYTYTLTLGLGDKMLASDLNSAFWGALTLGRLLAIPISIRCRPRTMLIGDLVGGLISVGIILLWSDSVMAVWVGTLGAGLSIASMFPTTLNFAERLMPITGKVTSLFLVGGSAGSMFLPWLIGQLFESIGPRVTMTIILLDIVLAGCIFGVLLFHSAKHRVDK